jgi:hypothetical protein
MARSKGNLKHGARSLGFPIVTLPAGCNGINDRLHIARMKLIDAVITRHGSLSIQHECKIELAIGFEQGRQRIARAAREATSASLPEKIAAQQYQDAAAEKRDRAIASLGLDTAPTQDADDAAWADVDTFLANGDATSNGSNAADTTPATQLGGDYD